MEGKVSVVGQHIIIAILFHRTHASTGGGPPSSGTIANAARGEDLETTAYAGLDQLRLLSSNSVVLGKAENQMC